LHSLWAFIPLNIRSQTPHFAHSGGQSAPSASALQSVHDAADRPTIINPRLAALAAKAGDRRNIRCATCGIYTISGTRTGARV
jgi:hypothetical protein